MDALYLLAEPFDGTSKEVEARGIVSSIRETFANQPSDATAWEDIQDRILSIINSSPQSGKEGVLAEEQQGALDGMMAQTYIGLAIIYLASALDKVAPNSPLRPWADAALDALAQ